ncbi:hypothetical protein A3I95_00595 [Candidatus Nomurabacteria bacterium RIFCSPLOWO2_02_FULL_44_12]|uniref:IPT/TIG domain-containing protein n=1 Tax=Candidatus Nomurabacteria bacterium RIFCSPLOWO2_12_FULL_44_11 TaxID=1801796 RepID=A0A1F6Y7X4_9BACT|nr:MAG: hypothetical protein A3E95_01710 [Candidatus Nomurabacteria bacterium RIFCSPHIGHO2_12_FULL_44_22b]OGJ02470.1 MAG: hypothetical protein A3G53_01065 [Candidatus Nomurabacteria bacterium RIFCSPLOWO2_12_FULL_44_11]OGJ07305.1 MAG: hypothetical protein A3I95_00595 [Candidatus Nomurabacteria bacterium RIFCSPLOWO2_02_FULL_44_12]
MNNIKKNLILAVLLGAVAFLPGQINAYVDRNLGGENYTFDNSDDSVDYNSDIDRNPIPRITYINPDNATYNNRSIEVTVRGSGFVPDSRVRFDGSSRPILFESSTSLIVTLSASDLSVPGIHAITVVNPGPGGGTSNVEYFTAKESGSGAVLGATTYRTTSGSTGAIPQSSQMSDAERTRQEFNNLTANAFYGAGSFMPSGLIGWVLVAIIILVIIILIRRFFGRETAYHSTPLKHS